MHAVLDALEGSGSEVAVRAPGAGDGYWAGGPSAVLDDGVTWLAYRLRRPVDRGRGYANVIARSTDGVRFTDTVTLTSASFAAASLERPTLVHRPDGGWRLYVSCASEGSKHWWVEAVDAPTVPDLATGTRTMVLPGDQTEAWKDVVVHVNDAGWSIWACRHPLDGGDDEADRMSTWFGTSRDGLSWTMHGEALSTRPGLWDARGARVSEVIHDDGRWWALYDGRRSAAENWHERCGLATGTAPDQLTPVAGPVPATPGHTLRYASVVTMAKGWRAYFEASAEDGSHDLRTVYIPRPSLASQSE